MSSPRILIVGRSGQMASAFSAVGADRIIGCAGRPDLDLQDAESVQMVVARTRPDVIINTAAYTAVDRAESEPVLARAINVDGARYLAEAARDCGAALIHLSTDCVFDGELDRPYRPEDGAHPLNVYGQSKLDGERAVIKTLDRHLIVRVSWIFSRFGGNFVLTMLRAALQRDEVSVVSDQIGCPSHAPDLAEALLRMAHKCAAPDFDHWGTYHLAGAGETDRASFAREIYTESVRHGGPVATVRPVPTADYPTPARRPLNARLDMQLSTDVFGVVLPPWRDSLEQAVSHLVQGNSLS